MLVIDSKSAAKFEQQHLGGKAYNLAVLSKSGYNVPSWWVISVDACREFLEQSNTISDINQQLSVLTEQTDMQEITAIAEKVQAQVETLSLSEVIKTELVSLVGAEELDNQFWAVRSSVVGEDAKGASFAGQMDSMLYQTGQQAVFDAVIAVIKSAFNARALKYRLTKGLALTDIRAAVIIQKMIDADISGVMFTANPISGNRSEALISAAWGCGEGIVSGLCNTDEITIGLNHDTINQTINEKDLALVFDNQSNCGVKQIEIDELKAHEAALSASHILQLRDMGKSIAETYRFPQDIEWCIKDRELYILQSRPITSLPNYNADTDRKVVWDNSNIQESYCGVTTPLTFSFASQAYKTVYEQTMRLLGESNQTIQDNQLMLNNMLGLIHGRVYYNINNWYKGLLFLPSFKANKEDMERMMGLQDPVDLVQDVELSFSEKLKKLPQIFRALFKMLTRFRKMDQLVSDFKQFFQAEYHKVEREKLHTQSIGQLVELSQHLDNKVLANWTTPIINDFYVMMMNGKVHRWLTKLELENPDLVKNNLLSGEEGIESTEPTKFLLDLCDQIRQRDDWQLLFKQYDNDKLLGMLELQAPALYQQCQQYIELYGDRTMGELKLESITLRQDASFMFAILKNFLAKPELSRATLAQNEAAFRQEAEDTVFTLIKDKHGRRGLKKFKSHLSKLRDAIRNRENMRLDRTRLFGLYRDIFSEIGKQLEFYDCLDDERDVFYLSIDEIYAYNEGRTVTALLKPLVEVRKAEYAQYEQHDLPHHFYTHGAVYCNNQYEYPHEVEQTALDADTLEGIGCYPGEVETTLRLIFSPDDELNLNGQILCTVRTDPGWAPLFPTAGGIVVERGSTLSHSAVVARELGIPAIVGVPNLTKIVSDKEMVRMNGSTGRIQRLTKNK